MSTPVISVLMAVRNGIRFVNEAVTSILTQTESRFEFLIIDDGSTDGTAQCLEQIEDERVSVVRQDNVGLTKSLNRLLAKARGQFIARMDADDCSLPKRFSRQIDFLTRHPSAVAVGSDVIYMNEFGRRLFRRRMPSSHAEIDACHLSGWGGFLVHPSVMMRADAVREVGGYDESLTFCQDYDLWTRLALQGQLANLPEPLLLYRYHDRSISRNEHDRQNRFRDSILAGELGRRGLSKPIPLSEKFRIRVEDCEWMMRQAAIDGCFQHCIQRAAETMRKRPKLALRCLKSLILCSGKTTARHLALATGAYK